MQVSVEALEKERDFYYGKLRSIEIMCTDKEGEDEMGLLVGQIFEVLYATEDGFQVGLETQVQSTTDADMLVIRCDADMLVMKCDHAKCMLCVCWV